MDDMVWEHLHLPNTPLIKCTLSDKYVQYLWQCIEDAMGNPIDAKSHLAGNISSSIYLEDKDDYFFKNALQEQCERYIRDFNIITARNSFEQFEVVRLRMLNFWANSQRQTEFNPTHNHGGVLSFVVWLKIPTHWKDQHELPIAKTSNTPMASDFQLLFTDILGSINGFSVPMSSDMEGQMCVFPSSLIHQVYPFYECDEDRISISGNLYFDPDVLHEIRENEYN